VKHSKRLDGAKLDPQSRNGSGLAGYVVISADDEESAVQLASGCPGLASAFKVEVGEAVDAQQPVTASVITRRPVPSRLKLYRGLR
jgi:hypothetical protein